jgi:hypothetical protein
MSARARLVPALLISGLAVGCATKEPCPPPSADAAAAPVGTPAWQEIVTSADHQRLRNWRDAMVDALAQARKDGHGAEIDAEGALLDPDRALDQPALPPGDYRCSMMKLGVKDAGHTSFIRYPAHHCRVKTAGRGLVKFTETDGLQRPSGLLYPDSSTRMVFLGTVILGDEVKPISYGRDVDRDWVGALQRIGDRRWRMLLPYPAWESQMDVIDIVPQ